MMLIKHLFLSLPALVAILTPVQSLALEKRSVKQINNGYCADSDLNCEYLKKNLEKRLVEKVEQPYCEGSDSHCIYIQGGNGWMYGQEGGFADRCIDVDPTYTVGYGTCWFQSNVKTHAECGDYYGGEARATIHVTFSETRGSTFKINGDATAYWSSNRVNSKYATTGEEGDDLYIFC